MRNEMFVKNFAAAGAIAAYRAVKFGSSDSIAAQATARNSAIFGVSDSLGADAAGDPVDVIMGGVATIEYGGTITRGDQLTSDANGKAIAAVNREYTKTIAGGAAGALTLTGILTTDTLESVIVLDRDATAANITLIDLTSEFSISAADTITNTGGTATSGNALLVTYSRRDSVIGQAMVSGVSGDLGSVKL